MWLQILIAVAAVFALFLLFVATRPGEFKVTRSATMNASARTVFPHVNDFRRWQAWSPWEKLDSEMKKTYEGPPEGTGTMYSWEGKKEVGAGKMTITESRPYDNIRIKLEFFRPYAGTNTTDFAFQPRGSQTNVVWSMTGHNSFMGKFFCLFMNMDKMIGGKFEEGLAELKSVAESAPQS